MSWGLSFILALTMLLLQPPILEGGMTYYNTGRLMRNGQPLDLTAATCAVSFLLYEQFVTKTVTICTERKCTTCTVTDSGLFPPEDIDVTPAVFETLRDHGSPDDNDGRLSVRVWKVK